MIAVAVISEADQLLVRAGQRHLRMKLKDLEHYVGQRALRGPKLPRGLESGRRRRRVFLRSKQLGLVVERGAIRVRNGRHDRAAAVVRGRGRACRRIGLVCSSTMKRSGREIDARTLVGSPRWSLPARPRLEYDGVLYRIGTLIGRGVARMGRHVNAEAEFHLGARGDVQSLVEAVRDSRPTATQHKYFEALVRIVVAERQ